MDILRVFITMAAMCWHRAVSFSMGEEDYEEENAQKFAYLPGLLDDIDGQDVYADTPNGILRGKRRPVLSAAGQSLHFCTLSTPKDLSLCL